MTSTTFDPAAAARYIADAHAKRQIFTNLPEAIAPRTIADAYAAQEALRSLWEPLYGPVAGWKIAVTTKVMQDLMGIHHPCGGMIYTKRMHRSPLRLKLSDHMHVVVECELGVRLKSTLNGKSTPWTAAEVRREVAAVLPAYELIEDRNAGVVLGDPMEVTPDRELNGLACRLETPSGIKTGVTDDPMGALAWVANLGIERGRPVQAGQVVITGSVVQTLPIAVGERFVFSIDTIGSIEMTATP